MNTIKKIKSKVAQTRTMLRRFGERFPESKSQVNTAIRHIEFIRDEAVLAVQNAEEAHKSRADQALEYSYRMADKAEYWKGKYEEVKKQQENG